MILTSLKGLIVDHHNHTFIGVFAPHFHLRPKRQLAVGSRQGVPPKDLTTGGFVSVETRPIPSGPTNNRLLRCRLNIVVGLGVLDLVAGTACNDQQHNPDDRGHQRKCDSHRSCEECGGRVHVDLDPP